MMHSLSKLFRHRGRSLIAFAGIAVILVGCQSNPPKFTCSRPTGFDVAQAFGHARADLSREECQFQFDSYVDNLLEIAETDPKPENKRHFSEFFVWARDQGILSRIQAQDYYQRYFTANFTTLSGQYNNCSSTCNDQAAIVSAMKDELRDKDRGLLQVSADRRTYAQADKEYNQLLTLIEATCLACQSGSP